MSPLSWSLLALTTALPVLRVLAQTQAQDLGTYLSLCATPMGFSEVGTDDPIGKGVATYGGCSSSSTPASGHTECPNSFLEGYCTNDQCYFSCSTSLQPLCPGTICPVGTQCISTTDNSGANYYFCGIQCAGGYFLCDAAGAQRLNSNWVPYCSPAQDVCATCASSLYLTADGGCTMPIITFDGQVANSNTPTRKRRLQQKLAIQEEMRINPYCPRGLTRCNVPGVDLINEYECVDTASDLESCGGCAGSGGVDCSALPGVAMGAVTCTKGECVASKCERGYHLKSGECISNDPNAPRLQYRGTTFERMPKTSLTRRQVSRERMRVKEQLGVRPGQEVTVHWEVATA